LVDTGGADDMVSCEEGRERRPLRQGQCSSEEQQ
jgi:hypothetical protein